RWSRERVTITTTGDELRGVGEEFDPPVTTYSASPETRTRHPRLVTRRTGRGSAQPAPRSVSLPTQSCRGRSPEEPHPTRFLIAVTRWIWPAWTLPVRRGRVRSWRRTRSRWSSARWSTGAGWVPPPARAGVPRGR